jgi:hypothetical protein
MRWAWKQRGVICLLLLACTLAGCSKPYYGYPGPRLPENETALLAPDAGVKIVSIDGQVVNIRHESESGLMKTTRAILRPGLYRLVLIPQNIQNVKTFTEIQAELAANRHYRVRVRRLTGNRAQAGRYEFWVENKISGMVVSTIGTSSDPFRE